KATPERAADLVSILGDILNHPRLDNRERIHQLVLKQKASTESRIVPAGNHMARLRLAATLYQSRLAEERMFGVSYLEFLRDLAQRFEVDWTTIASTLERIRAALVNRASMLVNVTADAAGLGRLEPHLASVLETLPTASPVRATWRLAEDHKG